MRVSTIIGIVAVAAACCGFVGAQPPEGRDGPPPPERRDGPPPHRHDGLRAALDTDGNHELDADEIKNAATSLAKADANGDGRIDHEEFRPPLPPIPRGERGFRGPQPPPPPREEGSEGRPPRETGERGPRPEGGPSPERLLERAMTFDADGDGKLDRSELEKFAGETVQRMRAAIGGRGGPPDRGRAGRDGEGPPRRRPEEGDGGERPERPRRPE